MAQCFRPINSELLQCYVPMLLVCKIFFCRYQASKRDAWDTVSGEMAQKYWKELLPFIIEDNNGNNSAGSVTFRGI